MENQPETPRALPRLKLTLRPTAESIVRSGHPWVYSESIRDQNREGAAGELAVIYDRRDKFLAVGFYDPDSPLRVRILHTGKPATIDEAWWRASLEAALARREGIADARTNGLRLLNGESDGWPGLVLDRYDTTLVVKLYSPAWLERLEMVKAIFLERIGPERLVLRLSRNLEETARESGHEDGTILHGPPLEGPVVFLEEGLRFEADVLKGQKTGFFLDQRENRDRIGQLAMGRDVLNAFSFTGGFSLHAGRGGALSVTDLDLSSHALEAAARNFALNREDPRIAACRHLAVQDDAFAWIDHIRDVSYDLIITDPPSLAKREVERSRAIQAYGRLNANAIRLLRHDGILLAASCSAHVSAEEFFGAVRQAARQSGRRFEEIETTGHAPDHHATFPEAEYLKGIYLRFD